MLCCVPLRSLCFVVVNAGQRGLSCSPANVSVLDGVHMNHRRGDSCLKCKGPSGEDLSKGFYEAGGSFLKLGLVESFLVTLLADSVLSFKQGYSKAGDLQNGTLPSQGYQPHLHTIHIDIARPVQASDLQICPQLMLLAQAAPASTC